MATGIYPLQNGKYRWQIMVEGHRFHGVADSVKEAQQARAQKLAEQAKGLVIAPSRVTLGEQLAAWLAEKDQSRAKRTSLGYRYSSEKYISDSFKARKLKDIRPVHIRQLYTELQERGVTESNTLRLTHVVIHGVFEFALKDELIARNPAHGLKPNTTNKDDVKDLLVLNPAEATRFAAACRRHRWGPVFLFMLLTGVRRGEACGVTWSNVFLDADSPHVRIEQALHVAGKEKVLTRPKTKTSRRTLYLSADVVTLLKQVRQQQQAVRDELGDKAERNDFVFTNLKGDSLSPDNLKVHMTAICKAAEVPRIRIHDLRHKYASLALRAGVRIEVLSKQLGHASAVMTLDVYRHVYVEEMQQTALPTSVLFGHAN
ncbi:site-specific integrase [Deinococcus aerolatus]|uniref:Site-specific integrase n=1 Tax=Deinococcus aerolatus TaxID=522487 RepID=A0ABQ2G572_9DEIO|nr:site-specific integrase [Deinococcus aerolatus]GGL75292.1 site-specific integrase [Deinococcus aerolatus]